MNICKRIAIKRLIKKVNKDIKIKYQKYDMECDVYEDTVYIGKTYDSRTDEWFLDYVKEIRPDCNINNVFLLSLFHEIGHIMTWTEEDMEEKNVLYEILKVDYEDKKEKAKEYCDLYFRIPFETEATEWGIDYLMEHPELVKKYNWL